MSALGMRPVHVIGGGLAGSEAAWQLAQAGVPVVLTSGYLADTSREEVEAEGFACLLAKPFSRRTLALAVQTVVGRTESAQSR